MSKLLFVNPKKRGSKKKAKRVRVVHARANPAPKRRRKRRATRRAGRSITIRARRNPIKLMPAGFVPNIINPAVMGALGALAVDAAVGVLPIPSKFMTGYFQQITKMAVALGIATFGGRVTKRGGAVIKHVGVGAFTVALHDLGRTAISKYAPNVKLGEYITDGQGGLQLACGNGLGDYIGLPAPCPQMQPAQGVGEYIGRPRDNGYEFDT